MIAGSIAAILLSTVDVVQAECTALLDVQLTKPRLRGMARQAGIQGDPWEEFEYWALRSIDKSIAANVIRENEMGPITPTIFNGNPPRRRFFSEDRAIATDGRFQNVAPDGYGPLKMNRAAGPIIPGLIREFENSVFYEAKSLTNTTLTLSYPFSPTAEEPDVEGRFQIAGLVDAVAKSPAGVAGLPLGIAPPIPYLFFLTTFDTRISPEIVSEASIREVALVHSYSCEVIGFGPNNFQMSEPLILNPDLFFALGWVPLEFANPGTVRFRPIP